MIIMCIPFIKLMVVNLHNRGILHSKGSMLINMIGEYAVVLTSYCTVLDRIHECLFCFLFRRGVSRVKIIKNTSEYNPNTVE